MDETEEKVSPNDDHPLARVRLNDRNFESAIDQIIRQARTDGHFDNLPGAGKPQKFDDDSLVPDDLRLGYRMLKSNGFAPLWVESRRDIDTERVRMNAWLADTNRRWPQMSVAGRAKAEADYRTMLADFQRMITIFNLNAPSATTQIEGLRMTEELARLGRT